MKALVTRALPIVALPLALLTMTSAGAATTPSLFGGASFTSGGVQLVSNSSVPFSGIDFAVPAGTTFGNLGALSATFKMTAGDCGGGSPRYQINVDTGGGTTKNVFVYFGPFPNFTGCGTAMQSTGNLLQSGDARFDTSQIAAGTQQSTYAQAAALLGSDKVTGIQLVVDAGWKFPQTGQAALISSATVNGVTFNFAPPTTKQQCKKGGWKTFVNPTFKNQGQCVSYVNHLAKKHHGK